MRIQTPDYTVVVTNNRTGVVVKGDIRKAIRFLELALTDAPDTLAHAGKVWECERCLSQVEDGELDLRETVCHCGKGEGRWGVADRRLEPVS